LLVTIQDSAGHHRLAETNEAGNFRVDAPDWTDITYPLSPKIDSSQMQSLRRPRRLLRDVPQAARPRQPRRPDRRRPRLGRRDPDG